MITLGSAVAQNVAFWILAVGMAMAAIGVVRSQNVVHSALFLVVVLAGAAAQYILVAAEFVAWVQVLIYIGAVVILFLFGIMLTRAPMRAAGSLDNNQRLAAAAVALFLVASQAELTQTPFDMPVAESELVAGYMVEYTGFRFLFFFIGEFGTAFAFAAIAATLFLGGWSLPSWLGLSIGAERVIGPIVLVGKVMLVAFVMFWARFTYPRLREDQLQALAWKFLIPIGLLNILVTGALKVAF